MEFSDLKPCPFCGFNVEFLNESRRFKCSNCGAVITFDGYAQKPETELINRYNERNL